MLCAPAAAVLVADTVTTVLSDDVADLPVKVLVFFSVCAAVCNVDSAPFREARRDVFDYIEMFYNPKRRHGYAGRRSPVQFEQQYFNQLGTV